MKKLLIGLTAVGSLLSGTGFAFELPYWMTERKIIGDNNLEGIEAAKGTKAYDYASIIARVETRDGEGFCTGWRVAEDMFITNYHCHEVAACDDLQFHLGYEKSLAAAEQKTFKCAALLAKELTFDYAIYKVATTFDPDSDSSTSESSASDTSTAASPVATLWTGPIAVGQALILAGHPAARQKEIDRSADCKLRTITTEVQDQRQTITHTCDSEGGSSGSPVMDRATGNVVALHWGGTTEYNMSIPISLVAGSLKEKLAPEIYAKLKIAH